MRSTAPLVLALLTAVGCGDPAGTVNFISFDGAESMSASQLRDYVDVRMIDIRFPSGDPEKSGKILWKVFANNPHESSFNAVALVQENNDEYWSALETAVLSKAGELNAPTEGLKAFFDEVYPHQWALLIPVSSYLVSAGRDPAWVVICKWEGRADVPTGLSHIEMWLINAATGEILADERCG